MKANSIKALLYAGFQFLFLVSTFSQEKIPVFVTGFSIIASDSAYLSLQNKLPRLVCEGILYNSSLELKSGKLGGGALHYDINQYSINSGLNERDNHVKLLDSLKVKFLIDGELNISYDQFYLKVIATGRTNEQISYQSKLKPLTDFQKTIDEACENLNYKIRSALLDKSEIRNIAVENFYINQPKNQFISYSSKSVDMYSPDFPARYIAYNLQSSQQYVILPYEGMQNLNSQAPIDISKNKNPDIVISGSVDFDERGYCTIQPVIYFSAGDSMHLPTVRDVVQNRDRMLLSTLSNIQSLLNAVAVSGTASKLDNDFTASDYENSFNLAIKNNNLSLAFYYADRLSGKFPGQKLKADLYKGIVYYKQDNTSQALDFLKLSLSADSLSQEANYYTGVTNIKAGRYEMARSFLQKVDTASSACEVCKDIFFQRGICSYNQNLIEKALYNFKKQEIVNDKINPELFSYISNCYKDLSDWKASEIYLTKLYSVNPSQVNAKRLSDFYSEYAGVNFDARNYQESLVYYQKAYRAFKTYTSLFGQMESLIKTKLVDTLEFEKLIQDGITNDIIKSNYVYIDLAELMRAQVDSNNKFIPYYLHTAANLLKKYERENGESSYAFQKLGSTYFRLFILDSAEYYYKKVKQIQTGDPVNYLNLAELQVMQLKADSAISTLEEANKKFKLNSLKSDDDNTGLYYFYVMASKIIKKQNYDGEQRKLEQMTNTKSGKKPNIFPGWSFRTFYYWLTGDKKMDVATKKSLLSKLCLFLPYSDNTDLSCTE